jgi:hypothetical protein
MSSFHPCGGWAGVMQMSHHTTSGHKTASQTRKHATPPPPTHKIVAHHRRQVLLRRGDGVVGKVVEDERQLCVRAWTSQSVGRHIHSTGCHTGTAGTPAVPSGCGWGCGDQREGGGGGRPGTSSYQSSGTRRGRSASRAPAAAAAAAPPPPLSTQSTPPPPPPPPPRTHVNVMAAAVDARAGQAVRCEHV